MHPLGPCPPTLHDDGRHGRAFDDHPVALDPHIPQFRALAGIEIPPLQRRQQGIGFVPLCLYHDPTAEVIRLVEMRVICRDHRQASPFGKKQVSDGKTVSPVATGSAAVIVDFHGMRRRNRPRICQGQPRPLRMGYCDKGPGGNGPFGDFGSTFLIRARHEIGAVRRREIWRQPNGEDVPQLAIRHGPRMQLRPQNRGETLCPKGHGIDDGIAPHAHEVIRQGKEIIPLGTIAAAHFFGRKHAIRSGGMGMQVPAPETPGSGESGKRSCHAVHPD